MAISPANFINLTSDQLAKWLIEDIAYKIQIARVWPFMGIQGGKISYARTAQFDSGSIDALATILGDGDATAPADKTANPDTTNSTFTLGELAVRYKLDYSVQDRFKVPNDYDAVQSALAIRRLIYMYFRKLDLVQGASTLTGNFPSLNEVSPGGPINFCAPGQRFASTNPAAAAAKLDELQRAFHLIRSNNGRPNAIMCNSRAARYIVSAFYNAGTLPEYVEAEWSDPIRGTVRAPQLAINGVPIYINELVASAGSPALTRVYFMVLGDACEAGPTRGVTGIVPGPLKDTMFVRRESSEAPTSTNSSRIVVDYTFPVATAMGSSGSLSILDDVNVNSFA